MNLHEGRAHKLAEALDEMLDRPEDITMDASLYLTAQSARVHALLAIVDELARARLHADKSQR